MQLSMAIWLLEQMDSRHDPISKEQVRRFGNNPEVCLTEKCLSTRKIGAGANELQLGPDNQPVYTRGEKFFIGETEADFRETFHETVGEAPPEYLRYSILGFLGHKLIFLFESSEKCWIVLGKRVVGEFLDIDYDDLKISIDRHSEQVIFWSRKFDRVFTLEKNARSMIEVKNIPHNHGQYLAKVLRYADQLYAIYEESAKVVRLVPGCPEQLKVPHSTAIDACVTSWGLHILVREPGYFKVYQLNTDGDKDRLSARIEQDRDKLDYPYIGGFTFDNNINFRFIAERRHGQVSWYDFSRLGPTMSQVTDIFRTASNKRQYWGIVGPHLCLMEE